MSLASPSAFPLCESVSVSDSTQTGAQGGLSFRIYPNCLKKFRRTLLHISLCKTCFYVLTVSKSWNQAARGALWVCFAFCFDLPSALRLTALVVLQYEFVLLQPS